MEIKLARSSNSGNQDYLALRPVGKVKGENWKSKSDNRSIQGRWCTDSFELENVM